ncbi:MAG TPA: hypothetical protein VJ739_11795 [Gemmataceae bacterium]|nr:hypothetical protein [Gemmataceae bacterium]
MTADDDMLDDAFHFAALRAYLEVAAETGGRPESEPTRRRAYQLYEQALAEKNRAAIPVRPFTMPAAGARNGLSKKERP